MTKAKARERAKAKAAQKIAKRQANADQPTQEPTPGRFDPGNSSIKGLSMKSSARSFGPARRGSARSR
ncbi:MAG: hypothetical protein HOL85_17660 [Rhodospirillaceae bacterium]|jgi:hypothetical protein|nr:hypothetical protein [Rhodospirillaceae bacterium]MBT6135828.1 hypothetical protein [Rhodospirillaceae bacterium]